MTYGKVCACEGGFVPFSCAQEAWFWFMDAYTARCDGAQIVAGSGLYNRPCDPLDILNIVQRLYKRGSLNDNHIKALRRFGAQGLMPDASQKSERASAAFWEDAMVHLSFAFQQKGIILEGQCDGACEAHSSKVRAV